MSDDRRSFAERQLEDALALGADQRLQREVLEATTAAHGQRYSYVWTWLGVPVIQMPADVVALQEVIWETRPQVIVELGIARGGGLVLAASILAALGEGSVIGVDIDIRPHNRETVEEHPLGSRIRLIEGSSTEPSIVEEVTATVAEADRVMVILDSDHSHDHVLAELRAYGPMVSEGCYLVVSDTIVEQLPPEPGRWGPGNSPASAIDAYLGESDRFEVDAAVNGKLLMSCSRGGFLRCRG